MKVAELLEDRRQNWQELERLCDELQNRRRKNLAPSAISRFESLYRAACADLALADAYQLPPNTVQYLHRLVGRAHNQLYRSRRFDWQSWGHKLLHEVPQRIFSDRCVQVAFVLFWSIFILSGIMASWKDAFPRYAETVLTRGGIEQLEQSFSQSLKDRPISDNQVMAGFYIWHNTSIGLKCFAMGVFVIPGVATMLFNAAYLGAAFGYMARPDIEEGKNFFEFVTAHGPFELTAIVLSAGAGLRLGMSYLNTLGLTRADSMRRTATDAMPIMGAAMAMFFAAALIEGFVSPSSLPYWLKALVAILSSGMLTFYFLILGFPRR